MSVALAAMSMVAVGDVPDSAYGRAFQVMLEKNPAGFAEKHVALDLAYWTSKRPVAVQGDAAAWDRTGQCPCCGRVDGQVYVPVTIEKSLEASREWLERNK